MRVNHAVFSADEKQTHIYSPGFSDARAFSSIFAVSHFLADHLSVERMPAKAVGVEG
jgi:hypothetical protein